MSKERLEEIKENMEKFKTTKSVREFEEVAAEMLLNHGTWLVEQAERVQELESEYKVRQVEYLEEHIDRLEQQNKRYRELIKKMKRMVYDPDVDCGMICTEIIEMEESE